MLSSEEITANLLIQRLELTAYIATITRCFLLAEELFQEVCASAVAREEGFESLGQLALWTHLAGRNRALEETRIRDGSYRGVNVETLVTLEKDWARPDGRISAEELEALTRCLAELPATNQELVRLHYFEGRPGQEIAQRMGRPLELVYQSLAQIHHGLSQCVVRKLAEA